MRRHCVNRRQNRFAAACIACLLVAGCGSPAGRSPSPAQEAARAQNQAGTRALESGNPAGALILYRASLTGAESIEDLDLAGANLLNIALVHAQLGQWKEAHAAADKVIAAPRHYGQAAAAQAAARKAFIHLDEGDTQAALRWADTAERGCAVPCSFAAALENLRAHLALEQAQTDAAIRHASRAAELATVPAMEVERASAWRLLGRAYTRAGRTTEAAQLLANALELDRRLGLSARIALDLIYAGDNEARRGEPARGREFYERAVMVYVAAGNASGADSARSRLGALAK